ncbi:alkaline shock response membrane anchor protein AmaP [Paenibacillus yanchengensis]|uniref:Alkaline shock response membrane anchor protein AmaP n=1 Tax=Paenibacillus yanchengensis TaxID=2035833 RepID=A0ABW4YKT7_9BACL
MVKVVDKMLLFLYSIVIMIISAVVIAATLGWIPFTYSERFIEMLQLNRTVAITAICIAVVLLLMSLRFFIVSVARTSVTSTSIDQRTDFGDIRISMETIESLALKAASRQRGIKDLRARIKVTDAGLDIVLRTVIDGETAIPQLTEDVQVAVKSHIEEITGMPVAAVAVFIANVVQANTFKSRVE